MIKKIAIISKLDKNSVNYGNRLQAFALNRYLLKNYKDCEILYLHFIPFFKKKPRTRRRRCGDGGWGWVRCARGFVVFLTGRACVPFALQKTWAHDRSGCSMIWLVAAAGFEPATSG